jgi:nucleotide-binding universal stress UspA family protein
VNTEKVILVPLYGTASDTRTLQHAGAVLQRGGGHIDALFAELDPLQQPLLIASPDGTFPYKEWYDAMAELNKARRTKATHAFEQWLAQSGIAKASAAANKPGCTAVLEVTPGPLADIISTRALTSDFIVAALPGLDADLHLTIVEIALFQSGRPTLLVPAGDAPPPPADAPVVVAWKSVVEAGHALSSALPLLRDARETIVVQAGSKTDEASAARVLTYLARHGIKARASTIDGGDNAGHALLEESKRLGAGLLVLGAYSHNRAREIIFGGVTRHVLQHATIPVWFSR